MTTEHTLQWDLVTRLREGRTNGSHLQWFVTDTCREAADEIERLRAVNADLLAVAKKVRSALNDAFSAGAEEREGGSARRQGKLQEKIEQFRAECKAAIAKAEGGE